MPQRPSSNTCSNPKSSLPSNFSTIARLKIELDDVRGHVAKGIEREIAIISALKQLGATEFSDSLSRDSNYAGIMVELEDVKRQLQEERRRRMQAEEIQDDVERECREPFVVPALLEAFISISRLTSEAMNSRR